MRAPKKRVLIVDEHPLLCYGLKTLLNEQPDLACCGAVNTPEALTAGFNGQKLDLVVMGLRFPDADGVDLIKVLRAQYPRLPVLIVSALDETVYAERVLRAGASGFVGKHDSLTDFLSAVHCVLGGEIYLSRKMSILLLKRAFGYGHRDCNPGLAPLSNRELYVFQLLGAGLTSRKVATRLGISLKTVESHRENIKHKLGLSDGAQLVRCAVEFVDGSNGARAMHH